MHDTDRIVPTTLITVFRSLSEEEVLNFSLKWSDSRPLLSFTFPPLHIAQKTAERTIVAFLTWLNCFLNNAGHYKNSNLCIYRSSNLLLFAIFTIINLFFNEMLNKIINHTLLVSHLYKIILGRGTQKLLNADYVISTYITAYRISEKTGTKQPHCRLHPFMGSRRVSNNLRPV